MNLKFYTEIQKRHADSKESFAHLINVARLEIDEPFEVAPGILFRRAQPREVATLQEIVALTLPRTFALMRRNPYESRVVSNETDKSKGYSFEELPEAEWRYNVAQFSGRKKGISEFLEATTLTPWSLDDGPAVFPGPSSISFQLPEDLSRVLEESQNLSIENLLHLTTTELDELRSVHEKFQTHDDNRIDLTDAVRRFRQLRGMNHPSLQYLGYVSILESLITHDPQNDPHSSLTRQVRQKMLLLGKRFRNPLPYDACFSKNVDPGDIWKKLYAYRSSIAHGSKPNFDGRLKLLRSPKVALDFVKHATMSTMRQALEEPELVADLRKC